MNIVNKEDVRAALAVALKKAGKSSREVARTVGCSPQTVLNLQREGQTTVSTWLAIMATLGWEVHLREKSTE